MSLYRSADIQCELIYVCGLRQILIGSLVLSFVCLILAIHISLELYGLNSLNKENMLLLPLLWT